MAAGASHPPQSAAVALVGEGAVLVQFHAPARRTSRPLDADHRQALPLLRIRFGLMGLFGHATLRPVSPDDAEIMPRISEFHRFFA